MSTVQNSNKEFTRLQIDRVFNALTSFDLGLSQYYDNYMQTTYGNDLTERLDYIDIAEVSRFIVTKFKSRQVGLFPTFFLQVETILKNCDTYVDDLIVVGLFEGIQNIGGFDIDYYFGFDEWLQPLSKAKWDGLIDSWEGLEWRTKNRQP